MPASATIEDASPQFPAGTVLKAYRASRFPGPPPIRGQAVPPTTPTSTATVENGGSATFPAVLLAGERYFVGALVNAVTEWRMVAAELSEWVVVESFAAGLTTGVSGYPIEVRTVVDGLVAFRGEGIVGGSTTIANQGKLFQIPAGFVPAKRALIALTYFTGIGSPAAETRVLNITTTGEAKVEGGAVGGAGVPVALCFEGMGYSL